jgi:hypothetical protein
MPGNNTRVLFISTRPPPRKQPIGRQSARSNRNSPSQCRRQAPSAKSILRCVETMSNSGPVCGAPAKLPEGHQRWEKSMVFSIHSDHTIGLLLTRKSCHARVHGIRKARDRLPSLAASEYGERSAPGNFNRISLGNETLRARRPEMRGSCSLFRTMRDLAQGPLSALEISSSSAGGFWDLGSRDPGKAAYDLDA